MKKYISFLTKNGYSINTINTYKSILMKYQDSLHDLRLVKRALKKVFHKPNTAWTHYNVLISYMCWKNDKRVSILKELKLPTIEVKYMSVFSKNYLMSRTKVYPTDTESIRQKKLVIRFLFETGIRAHELFQIKNINEYTITVLGKGNKKRECFHNYETTSQLNLKIKSTKTLRLWCKELLGNEYSPHSIRRSFATHMLTSGANPKMVMLQLGHSKIETTFRYLNLSLNQNKKIYDKHF